MGAFEDYINGLEGKEGLDPLQIVKDLSELHNQEYDPVRAKVDQLNATIAEKDQEITNVHSEISRQKALNFDLSLQVGNRESHAENQPSEITGATITPEDLFKR